VKRAPPRQLRQGGGVFLAVLGVSLFSACGRTGLEADDWKWQDQSPPDAATLPDGAKPGVDGAPGTCVPTQEVCNGKDDDCNGLVDEVPPIPCPGGGDQYCVAGHFSECPKPCEVCLPGAERVCFNSYCKYWGVETCTADGKSFGKCKEDDPPPECAGVAKSDKYSASLEQCCLDHDYCCNDDFDLDHDGNTDEMIGNCEEVLCTP
jgi:hypothetical protein